ncbi:MAG: hypothetical protein QM683_18950 [Lacrimispora sp.]
MAYERNLHVLHQLKRHGAEVKDGDRILSEDEIDYLTMKEAWEVSIDTRMKYTGDKIIELYKDSLHKSDEMWKKLAFAQDKPMKVSRCSMKVSGISLQEYMAMMKGMQDDDRVGLSAHPEHFICHVSFDDGKLLGIEPFGAYGTPTLVTVMVVNESELGAQIKADKDLSFPISMAGRAFLVDGVTEVNSPYHQFKPTEDGFEAKLAVYWPEDTVDEIVSGHCLHLAMEFYQGILLTGKILS